MIVNKNEVLNKVKLKVEVEREASEVLFFVFVFITAVAGETRLNGDSIETKRYYMNLGNGM